MPSTWLLLGLLVKAASGASDGAPVVAPVVTSQEVVPATSAYAHAWTTSDSLREGRGRGYCLAAKQPTPGGGAAAAIGGASAVDAAGKWL